MTPSPTAEKTSSAEPTVSPVPDGHNGSSTIASSCSNDVTSDCVTLSYLPQFSVDIDMMLQDDSFQHQFLSWLRVYTLHGVVPTINAGCRPNTEELIITALYAGCRPSFESNFEFPFRVILVIERNTSCNQRRWNKECRELLMQVFLDLKPNGTNLLIDHINLLSPLRRQLLSEEDSVETIDLPVRLAVRFHEVTNLEIDQDVRVRVKTFGTVRRRSVQRAVEPRTLNVTAARRAGTVESISREVLLTVDANDEWTWSVSSSASSYVQTANKTSTATSAGIILQHVYVHSKYAPSGSSSALLRVKIRSDDENVENKAETFDISLSAFIKQAHVGVSLDRVTVAMSQSEPSTSRSIELRNRGNFQAHFSLSVLGGEIYQGGQHSSPFAVGISGTGQSYGIVPAEGTSSITVTFSPASVQTTGIFTSFLLIQTDAWDGDETNIEPSISPLWHGSSDLNGTRLWIRIEMIVTTVFVCVSDSALNQPGPLEHGSMTTTVVNTDMVDLTAASTNFTLQDLEHPGVEYQLRPRVWRNRVVLSPWLQIRPWSLVIRSGTSSSFSVKFSYTSKDLPIWTSEEDALTTTSKGFDLRFLLLIRLQGGIASSVSEADEVRSVTQRIQLASGQASASTSLLLVETTTLFVGNRTGMMIHLRDIFDNADAYASFEDQRSSITPSDKNIPLVELMTYTSTEPSVLIERQGPQQRGTMISGTITFDVIAVALGGMTVDVRINGTTIQQSPVNITIVPVECAKQQHEVPDSLGLQCLCQPGFYRPSRECRLCPEGRFSRSASNDENCDSCPEGYFSETGSTQCYECPSVGVTCAQGRLRLEPGTWCEVCASGNDTRRDEVVRRLKDQEEVLFYKCRHQDACLVNNLASFGTKCAEGHKGPLCDTCQSGYVKNLGTHECESCANRLWNTAFTLLTFTFIIAAITAVAIQSTNRVRRNIRSDEDEVDEGLEKDLLEATVVTFLDYLQIVALVASLQISPIGDSFQWVAQGSRIALFNPIQLAEVQCLTGFSVFTRLIVSMFLPGKLAIVVFLIQCAVYFVRFSKKLKVRIWKSMALPTIIRVLDFVHASTTSATTAVLTIYENPVRSTERLEVDISIEVGSTQHHILHLLAVISLITYVFGFPLGMATFLARKAWKLRRTRRGMQKLQKQFSELMSAFSTARYGFLWPQVVVIRKVFLVFISIYIVRPMDQLALVTFVLLTSCGFCVVLRPYIDRRGNYIQFISTVAAALTTGTGAVRYAIDNRSDTSAMWMVDVTFFIIQFVVAISIFLLILSTFPKAVKTVYAKVRQTLKTVTVCCQRITLDLKQKLCSCKRRRARRRRGRGRGRFNPPPVSVAPVGRASVHDFALHGRTSTSTRIGLRRANFLERQQQHVYHARLSRWNEHQGTKGDAFSATMRKRQAF